MRPISVQLYSLRQESEKDFVGVLKRLVKDAAMLAVGSGKMDIPAVINAADENVLRWLVVELDKCDTDMFEAVEQSYKYLISNKLAEGNK